MASIRTKKTGVIIEDTIATGRRINVQLGQKVSKREQATLLAIYNKYKASLTEDQRKVISGAAIRQYLLAMRQMPDEMADR